ncbi:Uncharacterised protein [Burkholderia pseudomallei]|nr:hypothetical protein DO65_6449 [Burkholderia pseudomallei]CAJ4162351.1 Uncharacterised protein [Burkholderia pseudomallei]CAJ4314009.1 Uncharacterised protein [Burkholderia pseudomallei]CAJ5555815.1 Uncharacterised protein [Burkholderia pseudomallei]CAJ6098492.1 Uncharacterised protein [Burkholderia pseudomallei]
MPLDITANTSVPLIRRTNGFTNAGISLWPRKIVATAEHASMRLTPSSFAIAVPTMRISHFITPM